jgi:hypothetical protein
MAKTGAKSPVQRARKTSKSFERMRCRDMDCFR